MLEVPIDGSKSIRINFLQQIESKHGKFRLKFLSRLLNCFEVKTNRFPLEN